MGKYWRCGLAAAAVALAAHSALAQPVNGCPAGQAMQSSDPSGKHVTCVPIPNTAALQQQIDAEKAAREAQDANLGTMLGAEVAARQAADQALQGNINAEAAARQAADQALGARIDALSGETDIVGTWAVSGPTSCLQSTRGFDANFAPVVVSGQPTIVTHLTASSIGTRTFNAGGTGTAAGTTNALNHAGVIVGVLGTDGAGSANMSTFTNSFTWHLQPDGKLFIDDVAPLVQTGIVPDSRKGWTFTIDRLPPFEGYISKDKKTILMTHPVMQIETSTTLDQNGIPPPGSAPIQRFCTRHRVLTRLAD